MMYASPRVIQVTEITWCVYHPEWNGYVFRWLMYHQMWLWLRSIYQHINGRGYSWFLFMLHV